jgi:hypothetical protein
VGAGDAHVSYPWPVEEETGIVADMERLCGKRRGTLIREK